MGLFPGISGYTSNLEKMSNAPPHPPTANRTSNYQIPNTTSERSPTTNRTSNNHIPNTSDIDVTNRSSSSNMNYITGHPSQTNLSTSGGVQNRMRSPSQTPSVYSVSSGGTTIPRHPSSVRSSSSVKRSGDTLVGKKNSVDEDDDDEEVEIKISPTGSVLAPSPNPYDKTQKLRQANAQLMASRLPPKPPGKVRFNDSVITAEEPGGDHAIRSKKPKTNVTLPPTLKKNGS